MRARQVAHDVMAQGAAGRAEPVTIMSCSPGVVRQNIIEHETVAHRALRSARPVFPVFPFVRANSGPARTRPRSNVLRVLLASERGIHRGRFRHDVEQGDGRARRRRHFAGQFDGRFDVPLAAGANRALGELLAFARGDEDGRRDGFDHFIGSLRSPVSDRCAACARAPMMTRS